MTDFRLHVDPHRGEEPPVDYAERLLPLLEGINALGALHLTVDTMGVGAAYYDALRELCDAHLPGVTVEAFNRVAAAGDAQREQLRRAAEALPETPYVPDDIDGAVLIMMERERQIYEEGFGPEHDATHGPGGYELLWAAVCLAAPERVYRRSELRFGSTVFSDPWPADWAARWDKRPRQFGAPLDNSSMYVTGLQRIFQLKYAGAYIAAEIDRAARLLGLDLHDLPPHFPTEPRPAGTFPDIWSHLRTDPAPKNTDEKVGEDTPRPSVTVSKVMLRCTRCGRPPEPDNAQPGNPCGYTTDERPDAPACGGRIVEEPPDRAPLPLPGGYRSLADVPAVICNFCNATSNEQQPGDHCGRSYPCAQPTADGANCPGTMKRFAVLLSTEPRPDVWAAPYAHTLTDNVMTQTMLDVAARIRQTSELLRCDVCDSPPPACAAAGDRCTRTAAELYMPDVPGCPGTFHTLGEIVRRQHEARNFEQVPPLNLPADYKPPFGFVVTLVCNTCGREGRTGERHRDVCGRVPGGAFEEACPGLLLRTVRRDPDPVKSYALRMAEALTAAPSTEAQQAGADNAPVTQQDLLHAIRHTGLTVYEAQVLAATTTGIDPDRRMLYCTHAPDDPDHQSHTGFMLEGAPCNAAINLCPLVRCPGRMLPKLACDTCGHVYNPEQHLGDEPGARCVQGNWDGPEPRRCYGTLRVYVPRVQTGTPEPEPLVCSSNSDHTSHTGEMIDGEDCPFSIPSGSDTEPDQNCLGIMRRPKQART